MLEWRKLFFSVIGCFFTSLGVNTGYIPVRLFSSGFPGVGVLALYIFNWSVGLVVLALNIPLLLLAWKRIGHLFVIQTFIVAAVLSVFLDLMYPLSKMVQPPLWLGIILGGIFIGFGSGLVFRQGLTSGGVGLFARLIQIRFPELKMGIIHIAFDLFVLTLGALLMDVQTAILTFIASIIMGRMMDITKSFTAPAMLRKAVN